MAIQQVNIYGFSINLKSKQKVGDHLGINVLAAGVSPQAAWAVIQQQFAGDLTGIQSGATLVRDGVYTTLA